MSKSNRLNLNIIDRQEDEPDLTEQQFDDLCALLREIGALQGQGDQFADLGKWQARILIDQLEEASSAKLRLENSVPEVKSPGCLSYIIRIMFWCVFWIFCIFALVVFLN